MEKESPDRKILRIGHRGACGHVPENTLASIERAIALGCVLTEVDIRRTADGALVLLHDERVDRTTDGQGLVAEMILEDIRKLDAGGGERLPMLEDALAAASGRIGLILELKAAGLAYDVCAIVRAAVPRVQSSTRRFCMKNSNMCDGPILTPRRWFSSNGSPKIPAPKLSGFRSHTWACASMSSQGC